MPHRMTLTCRFCRREFVERKKAYKQYVTKHLDEETDARMEDEKAALRNNLKGLRAMGQAEAELLAQLEALGSEHQNANRVLAAALAHDPFLEEQVERLNV